jgi:hypothetical protein
VNFLFSCPEQGKPFETDRFELVDNRGVKEDAGGNRYLDARVRLSAPCPVCGKMHEFAANELVCPFEAE